MEKTKMVKPTLVFFFVCDESEKCIYARQERTSVRGIKSNTEPKTKSEYT